MTKDSMDSFMGKHTCVKTVGDGGCIYKVALAYVAGQEGVQVRDLRLDLGLELRSLFQSHRKIFLNFRRSVTFDDPR